MSDYIQLGLLIDSISKTHKFDKEELIFLNTSDVSKGRILIDHYSKVSTLKGQAKKSIQNGDILYSEIRPKNRRYAYVKNLKNPEDYVVSTKLMVLRRKTKNLQNDYLYHFLTYNSTINYLQRKAENRIGSFPQITFDVLKQIKIWLPDISTQGRIAKVLTDIDAKIEVNNKINKELEAMAKTLYDYWFIQFDFPDENGKPYKSSGGNMVYNEELKREIPNGWKLKSLDEIAIIKAGGDKPKRISQIQTNDCNIPIYSNGVINDGLYGYTNLAKIEKPSITVSARGTIGFSVLRSYPYVPIIRLISITPNSSFLIKFLHERVKLLKFEISGSVQKQLTVPQVSRLKIVVPNDKQLKQFHNITNSFIKIIENNKKQNKKLSELRDWLLPMLMNGQVTVRDAYKIKEEKLNIAAEPGQAYEKDKVAIDHLFKTINYDYEIAAIQMLTNRRFGFTYGKKYTHKMFSNIEMLNTMPKFKELTFEEKGWGMFSKIIAKTIDNQKFIYLNRLDNGTQVLKVKSNAYKEVLDWTAKGENEEFISQVNAMLTLYEKPLINKDMNRIELLNTVLECMKVLETDDLQAIRNKMANWEMQEEYNQTKAEKFTKNETLHMIQFIKTNLQ